MAYVDEMVWAGEQFVHRAPLHQRTALTDAINARKQMLEAGVTKAEREYPTICQKLREYDALLQLRFDHDEDCWVVDRRMPEGFHAIILLWRDQLGSRLLGDGSQLLDCLAKCDVQRQYATPEDYVAAVRERARKQREANEQAANEKVLEAVDSLSTKQLQNFVDVERAVQTGEKIIAHGSDERKLDKWHKQTQKSLAEGEKLPPAEKAVNPGMHPLVYNRKHR